MSLNLLFFTLKAQRSKDYQKLGRVSGTNVRGPWLYEHLFFNETSSCVTENDEKTHIHTHTNTTYTARAAKSTNVDDALI